MLFCRLTKNSYGAISGIRRGIGGCNIQKTPKQVIALRRRLADPLGEFRAGGVEAGVAEASQGDASAL